MSLRGSVAVWEVVEVEVGACSAAGAHQSDAPVPHTRISSVGGSARLLRGLEGRCRARERCREGLAG